MIRRFVGAIVLTVVGLTGGSAAAQEPMPLPSPAPVQAATPVVLSAPMDGPASKEAVIAAHLMLGMQTGIRGQLAVLRGQDWSLVGEGYYGIIFTRNMGSSEGGGLGGRAYFRKSSSDGCNSLVLGPGLNVFEHFQNHHLVLVAPSMELSWVRGFENGAGWESGLNVGVGIGVNANRDDFGGGERITPLISFFSGLRY